MTTIDIFLRLAAGKNLMGGRYMLCQWMLTTVKTMMKLQPKIP